MRNLYILFQVYIWQIDIFIAWVHEYLYFIASYKKIWYIQMRFNGRWIVLFRNSTVFCSYTYLKYKSIWCTHFIHTLNQGFFSRGVAFEHFNGGAMIFFCISDNKLTNYILLVSIIRIQCFNQKKNIAPCMQQQINDFKIFYCR